MATLRAGSLNLAHDLGGDVTYLQHLPKSPYTLTAIFRARLHFRSNQRQKPGRTENIGRLLSCTFQRSGRGSL